MFLLRLGELLLTVDDYHGTWQTAMPWDLLYQIAPTITISCLFVVAVRLILPLFIYASYSMVSDVGIGDSLELESR